MPPNLGGATTHTVQYGLDGTWHEIVFGERPSGPKVKCMSKLAQMRSAGVHMHKKPRDRTERKARKRQIVSRRCNFAC